MPRAKGKYLLEREEKSLQSLRCVQHVFKTAINAETSFSLLSLYDCSNLIFRGELNMQTSQSIVGAPWAEMMCKIAFLEVRRLGEEAWWNRHIISCTGRLFKWKKSPSIQPRSRAHGILFCPSSCSDYWAGMVHADDCPTQKHTDTQSLQLSSVVSVVTCLKVKRLLVPLVPGNRRAFGDSLSKTRIILSTVRLGR